MNLKPSNLLMNYNLDYFLAEGGVKATEKSIYEAPEVRMKSLYSGPD